MSAELTATNSKAVSDESLFPSVANPKARTASLAQQVYQSLAVAALAFASYFFFSHFVLQSVQVVGLSMAPTLRDSERYLMNRWMYYVRAPQREDVVVIRDPVDNGYSVKRIIATAGESVFLKNGHVFVNGRKLEESYLVPGTSTFPYLDDSTVLCGKDQFYVLGDNRRNSADSRVYGAIPRENIIGLIIR